MDVDVDVAVNVDVDVNVAVADAAASIACDLVSLLLLVVMLYNRRNICSTNEIFSAQGTVLVTLRPQASVFHMLRILPTHSAT